MRVVLQRVSRASVSVDGETVAEIGPGMMALVGIEHCDTEADITALSAKMAGLRMFSDEDGKMNRSVEEVSGEILVVSQFTLSGDVARGRRPSFTAAARPELAQPLIESLVTDLAGRGLPTMTGSFGATMEVELVNDGPVTLVLEVSDGHVR